MRRVSAIAACWLALGSRVGLGAVEPCAESNGPLVGRESGFIAQGATLEAQREHCTAAVHAFAGSAGSVLGLSLNAAQPHSLRVTDLLGEALPLNAAGSFTLGRSGEYLVHIEPADKNADASAYSLSVACVSGCDRAYTRFPVILMHGAAGFGEILGIEYFFGVKDHLAERGVLAFTPAVDPVAGSAERGREIMRQIDGLVQGGIARRFNLIGHSQGGVDARYVAAHLGGDVIVSVTTISSPHRGTPVADYAAELVDMTGVDTALIREALFNLTNAIGVSTLDYVGQLSTLTTSGMAAFNRETPDQPGVYYASYAGRSCGALDWDCQEQNQGEIVAPYLAMTHWLNQLSAGQNDGMCPVESAKWGEFKGTIPADHFDEVGHLVGITNSAFSHLEFFMGISKDLFSMGF
jgi:triacylglycerol lipase